MKKSPDRRDRTRKSRGARLEACATRCAGRAAGFCFPTAAPVGKRAAALRQRCRAPLSLARCSPAENDIPIINTKFLFSRLDFFFF